MSTATKDSQAKSGNPRVVALIALSMVAFELFCVALESALLFQSPTDYIKGGVRFLIACILAYFLFRGARWARWVTIVIALWAAVYSVLVVALLPLPIFFRGWGLVIGLFWLIIGLLLLFSKRIVGHFVPHHSKRSIVATSASSSKIEKQLEEYHVNWLITMGWPVSQAKDAVRGLLKIAKEESQKEGTSNLAQNFGDILLEKESTDDNIKSMLAKKRNEGVRNDDIRWWWNMHDLERRMMLKTDEWFRYSLYIKLTKEDGLNEREALNRLRKHRVIFGDHDTTTDTTGKDRPLPYELKDRINIYIENRSQKEPEQIKKDIGKSSSFNALIRKEIKKGNI